MFVEQTLALPESAKNLIFCLVKSIHSAPFQNAVRGSKNIQENGALS